MQAKTSASADQQTKTTPPRELSLFRVRVKGERGVGEEQEVYVQAVSAQQIRSEYTANGYAILEINELVSKGPVTFAKIELEEKAEFCFLMADLLKAGISFKQALNTIFAETNRAIAKAIPIIIKDLDEGKSVIDALSRHPGIFDQVMLAVLQTGEKSGEWPVPFEILGKSFEKDAALRNTVKLALLYPLIVLGIAVGVVAALAVYSFPNFLRIYNELGLALPWPTRVTIHSYSGPAHRSKLRESFHRRRQRTSQWRGSRLTE